MSKILEGEIYTKSSIASTSMGVNLSIIKTFRIISVSHNNRITVMVDEFIWGGNTCAKVAVNPFKYSNNIKLHKHVVNGKVDLKGKQFNVTKKALGRYLGMSSKKTKISNFGENYGKVGQLSKNSSNSDENDILIYL